MNKKLTLVVGVFFILVAGQAWGSLEEAAQNEAASLARDYSELSKRKVDELAEESIRKGWIAQCERLIKRADILITGKGGVDALGNEEDRHELGEGHQIKVEPEGEVSLKRLKELLAAKKQIALNYKIPDYPICYVASMQVSEALTGKWTYKEKVSMPREEARCDDHGALPDEKDATTVEGTKPYIAQVKSLCTGGAKRFRTRGWFMNENTLPKERTANIRCEEKPHRKGVLGAPTGQNSPDALRGALGG